LSCGSRTTTGGINLHIELEKPKLDQITARNIGMSLDKRIAFLNVKLRHLPERIIREQNTTSVIRIYLLYLQTVLIEAGPGARYSKQHVHDKFHVLSLESKFMEIEKTLKAYLAIEMSLSNT